jgi:hypothetical protein
MAQGFGRRNRAALLVACCLSACSRVGRPITIHTPTVGTRAYLVLHAQKNGVPVFDDSATAFTLTP